LVKTVISDYNGGLSFRRQVVMKSIQTYILRLRRNSIIALCVACFTSPALAQTLDLKTTLELANQNDPSWSAVKHAYDANKQNIELAKSGLLPRLSFSLDAGEERVDPKNSGTSRYRSETYALSLRQPLFYMEAWHAFQQAKQSDQQFDANFKNEEQTFYERVLTTYLNVLRAHEEVLFRQAEEKAIARQLEQTEQRHQVGLIAKTDVHEAQAAYDIAVVLRIIAERDLDLSLQNLKTLTGSEVEQVAQLASDFPVTAPEPKDPTLWLQQAMDGNNLLKAARNAEQAADYQFKSVRARHLPTLDLLGSYRKSYTSLESGELESSLNNNERSAISLSLQIPIYSGGQTSASRVQAKALAYQAQDQARAIERDITEGTMNLLRIVTTDVAQVKAQQQVIRSAESALEATQAGYEAGTRTIVDVLAAQKALYAAKKDYANARYNYILNSIRLKQIAGTLDASDLLNINAWLR
jgi:outer membrane protein